MTNDFTTVDLFCGCGGMSIGFSNAGFNIKLGLDNWQDALNVYKINLKHETLNIDLSNVNETLEVIAKHKPSLIIGGPPCQDFSHAGKRNENLGRADLTISFAEIIKKIKPKFFVMENVERTLNSKRYNKSKEIIKSTGYGLTEKILDASFYGVPQKRKRLFVVGELNGNDNFLDECLGNLANSERMTVRKYFEKNYDNHLEFEHYYRHPRNYSRRAIFSIDEPSATIRGVNRPVPPNYKSHAGDSTYQINLVKPLTTQQRAMIQTFPEDFIISGNKTVTEQMIGNAVPVKLAESVAKCLIYYMKGEKEFFQKKENQLTLF